MLNDDDPQTDIEQFFMSTGYLALGFAVILVLALLCRRIFWGY